MRTSFSGFLVAHRIGILPLACALMFSALAADPPPPEPGTVVWQYPLEGTASSIAVGADGQFYTTVEGRLLAFGAEGQLLWEHASDGWPFIFSPMITEGGLVLVATGHSWASEGVYQVQAVSSDGEVVWQLTDFGVTRMPAMFPGGDILLFSQKFGEPHLAHRLSPDGAEVWQVVALQSEFGWPSVRGDGVFFLPVAHVGGPDGSLIWDLSMGVACSTAAIGRDGATYFAMGPTSGFSTESLVARGTDGHMRWQYPEGSVGSAPAIMADDSIVFGTSSGKVVRVNKDGGLIWEQQMPTPVSSPAITADDLIWCGSADGRFLALNGSDGTVQWEWQLGSNVQASPAVGSDGRVYIAADGGGLYIIQGAAGPADSPWPMHRHDAARRARNDVALQAPVAPEDVTAEEGFERGAVAVEWSPTEGAETYEIWRGLTAVPEEMELLADGIAGETRFMDRTAGFDQRYYYRVGARNIAGDSAFSEPDEGKQSTLRWLRALASVPINSPALGNDGLLRVLIAAGMVAVDTDGEIQWQVETGPVLAGPVLGADNTAYCVTSHELIAFDAAGTPKWTTPLPEPLYVPTLPGLPAYRSDMLALTGDGDLVLGAHPERVYWYSAAGELIRTAYTTAGSAQAVVVTDDGGVCLSGMPSVLSMFERNGHSRWRVYTPNAGKLAGGLNGSIIGVGAGQVISKDASGALNWTWGYGPESARACVPVIGPDGTVYVARLNSQLIALASDGTPLWSVPGQINSSPALLADGTLLVYAQNRLKTYASEGAALWEVFLPGGTYLEMPSPIVAPNGTIYAVGGTNIFCLAGTAPLASEGWPSSRRDARQTGCLAGPSPAPQPVVDGMASEGTSVNQIRVSWAPNPDLAWVEVWRSPGSNLEAAVLMAVVDPGVFEYFDQGIHPGEISHYWLRALNDAGTTLFSEALRGYGAVETRVQWKYEGAAELSVPALGLSNQVHVTTADGQLLTLNGDGELVWSFTEMTPPLHGPVVGLDGTVFVLDADELVAVRPEGTLRWRRPLTAGTTVPMTVGWDGTIYMAQGNQLTAMDPEGAERWRTQLDVVTPPRMVLGVDDRLRVAVNNATVKLQANGELAQQITGVSGPMALAPDGALYIGSPAYKLSAFEPTGAVRFNFERLMSRPPAHEAPVLGLDQRAYISRSVGTLSQRTFAVDGQGQLLWEYPGLASGLVADDSGGLIIAQANHVTALRSDGTLRWDYQIDDVTPTPPLLTDAGALCFSAANRLIMLQTELRPAESGWAMWRADAQRSGRTGTACRVVACRKCETGELELRFAGSTGLTYFVERSSDLEEWSVVKECVALPGITTVLLSADEEEDHGFFRVRQ